MPITLTQALADVRTILMEPHPIVYDTPDLRDLLDQGQKDTAALTLCYQRRVAFANTDPTDWPIAGLRDYALTVPVGSGGLGITDAMKVLHVYLNDNALFRWTPEMQGMADARVDAGGTPRFYYEFAGVVSFIPYPNAAFVASTYTMEVVYAAYPVDWTSGDSVLPSGFDELPTYYTVAMAYLSRKKWSMAAAAYQHWLSLTLQYRQISLALDATAKTDVRQPVRQERLDEPRRVVQMRRG